MSFNNVAAKSVVNILNQLPHDPTVCELGNQTINLEADAVSPSGYRRVTELNGQSAELYYRALGFSDYVALDVNEKFGSHIVDLNHLAIPQLPEGVRTRFSLVTNNGTGEHLFNQLAIFQNCHDLCEIGGIMLHIMPLTNWINHGFYSFHPLLYVDVAGANRYELVRLSVADRLGFEVQLPVDNVAACTEQLKARVKGGALFDAVKRVSEHEREKSKAAFPNVIVVAALRKVHEGPFCMPMQGKYVGDITSDKVASNYARND